MMYFTDEMLDRLIKEDTPYLDLTTTLLEIGEKAGRIEFRVREDGIVACTEEAARILEKLGLVVIQCTASGTKVVKKTVILVAEGKAEGLHLGWKVCLNILEYCCGIATSAWQLVEKAQKVNPNISVVVTRKSFPGTKELIIKAALAGGALPHRLGLSESILVFKQHLVFLGGAEQLITIMPKLQQKGCEKKIIVEVDTLEDARKVALAGADALQFDKVSPEDLSRYVKEIKMINKSITLIAAGGITIKNADLYAATGIDAIATSAIFHGKPLDIEAKMLNLRS